MFYTHTYMKKDTIIRLPKALANPQYKGKHLVLVEGRVVAAGTWEKVSRALKSIYKQGKTPMITYMPKADSMILLTR